MSDLTKAAIMVRRFRGATGASRLICEQIRLLSQQQCNVSIYAEKIGSDIKKVLPESTRFYKQFKLPIKGYYSRVFFDYLCSLKTTKGQFDFTIGHGDVVKQDVLFLHNTIRLADELVVSDNDRNISYHGKLQDILFKKRHFALCVANSVLMKDDLCNRYQLDETNVNIIYPGYDKKQFSPYNRKDISIAIRKKMAIDDDNIVVSFITSGDFKKRGLDIFLKTLSLLPKQVSCRLSIIILGRRENIERYLMKHSYPLSKKQLQIIDKTSRISDIYHATDILFYPARYEEFGMVVQEAIACGAAVVSSARVGSTELLVDSARETIIDQPDIDDFVSLLTSLLTKGPQYIAQLAAVQYRCIVDNTYDDYNRHFLKLMKKQGFLS